MIVSFSLLQGVMCLVIIIQEIKNKPDEIKIIMYTMYQQLYLKTNWF